VRNSVDVATAGGALDQGIWIHEGGFTFFMESGFHDAISAGGESELAAGVTGTGVCSISVSIITFFGSFSAVVSTDLGNV
jgi:hypothetical protein